MLQDLGSTPVGCLAARCGEQSSEPWLFYRRGWKWRWASYGQVADQITRGLRIVRQAATSAPRTARWVTHGTQHPDTVAVACMLLEAGGTLHLRRPMADGSWSSPQEGAEDAPRWVVAAAEPADSDDLDPSRQGGLLEVPSVPGQLDRRPLEALETGFLDRCVVSQVEDEDGRQWTPADLRDRARRLAEALAEEHGFPETGSWLRRWQDRRRLPRRPIVCVSPAVSPVDLLVVAWATLVLDAAWVLEPQADAFLPTVDWVRPTVVLTDPEHEAELHRRLVALPRGQRRLRSVVGWPSGTPEGLDPQFWQELGVSRRVCS